MVYRKTGGRIIAGPFTGLRFVYDSDGIPLGPKLLGTYEMGCFRHQLLLANPSQLETAPQLAVVSG